MEHSDVGHVTSADYNGVNAIVTASILLNVHTMQSNAFHMTLNPLIKYICSVNMLCEVATAMLFRIVIPPQPGDHHVVVNLTHSTSNLS